MCLCVCVCGLDLRKKITPFEPGPPTHHTPHTALVARSPSPWFLRLRSLVDAADRLLNNSAPPEPRREPAHRGAASPSPEMPRHQPAPHRLRSLCFPAPMTLPPPLQNQNFFFQLQMKSPSSIPANSNLQIHMGTPAGLKPSSSTSKF